MSGYKEHTPAQLFNEKDASRYEPWHRDIWHRIINVHHTVLTLEHLAQFPLDQVSTPSESVFWRTVARNSWHAVVTTLHGLLDDQQSDALTLPRLKNTMLQFAWRIPEDKVEFQHALKAGRFDQGAEGLREKAKNLRHRFFAHRFIDTETGTIKSAATIMNIEELRQLFDHVEKFFQVCSVGSHFETATMEYSRDVTVAGKPQKLGVETVLEAVARSSYFVNEPERMAKWWPSMRERMNATRLAELNRIRGQLGMPLV